ncbi:MULTISPECIES: dihydrofolate reductase family protein [unclassified Spirosoma]|uniref:dihydrofolate reductase family protein n=1 Tax=unclassified Spirosoma TaxID=2621999 RepID=UPI000958F086|nr:MULTISPECIES: dihydrofolate reductase family protein [unclassified Spirosoma]MBN8822845.1 dihydrofolate reductase [Spirosoma sp.]OJW80042.1 MAG: dihydrofolate reductase [Spirosoma sp. 48-14]
MRKLIYDVAASFDNFIAHTDGSIDGFQTEGDFVSDFLERIKTYGAVLMGRKTYEWGFALGMQPGEPAYTQINPQLKNYIFSSSMHFEEGALIQLVTEEATDFVRRLKTQPGEPIWLCGGGELAGKLLDAHLIDELVVKLNPVVLGEGIRLFGSSQTKVGLIRTDSKPYENGLILLTYQIHYLT